MEGEKGMECTMEPAAGVEKASRFRRICVFCGSQCGKKASYQEAAIELGKELVMPRQIFSSNPMLRFFSLGFPVIHSPLFIDTDQRLHN